MAKVLTGWTYPTAPGATAKTNNPAYYIGQMFAVEAEHDTTAKTIFGNITDSRRADRGAGSGIAAGRADGAADHGAVRQPATDPAPGHQQSEPGLYPARFATCFTNDGNGVTRKYEGGDHGDSHRSGSARGRRSKRGRGSQLRPSARADPFHGEHSARPERDARRAAARSITTRPRWVKNLFNAPSVFSYFSPQSAHRERTARARVSDLFDADRGRPRRHRQCGSVRHSGQEHDSRSDAIRQQWRANVNSLLDYISYVFLHQHDVGSLKQAATDAANAAATPTAKAQAALYMVLTLGRIPESFSKGDRNMFSRRGFIRIGAATVGSLALRPFGLLPALAQSGPDYRALVCVFLFGGNDSNNTVIPMDDASFQGLHIDPRKPGADASDLTPAGHQRLGRAVCVSRQAGRTGEPVFEQGTGGGGERRIAGAAADARSVSERSRAPIPLESVLALRSAIAMADLVAQGNSPTGWAGRAADYIASQNINSSSFPDVLFGGRQRARRQRAQTQPVALAPGQSLQLTGFNSRRRLAGALERAEQPA